MDHFWIHTFLGIILDSNNILPMLLLLLLIHKLTFLGAFFVPFTRISIEPIRMSAAIGTPPLGTLDSMRSAARMGDSNRLLELVTPWRNHPILNDKAGDFMGLSILHWAVAAGAQMR